MKPTIAFIGGGNMARSLIGGLLKQGYDHSSIRVSEPYAPTREALAAETGIPVHDDNPRAAAGSAVWLFAVKPQVMKSVCAELKDLAQRERPLILSIAAGITATQLETWLGDNLPVVRIMPNTPALLGAGASGLFANARVSAEQKNIAGTLFEATGICAWISDEAQMDTVTRLVAELVRTYGIHPRNVVGHSDVAPARKEDPGELFDWEALAKLGLAIKRPSANLVDPGWSDATFLSALERYGYGIADGKAATVAFQRRFRPTNIDGAIDCESRAILHSLLLAVEGNSVI